MEEYILGFKIFQFLHKHKKLRQPYMCQLFTCATSLVELNQMMLDFFMDQLPSGRVQIMYLGADAVFFV